MIGIVLILMPEIMNPVYQSTEGMIVECVKADPVWREMQMTGYHVVQWKIQKRGRKK